MTELLERLEAKRQALTSYLSDSNLNHVVVADVGDILEGFENTGQQPFTNGLSLMDQVEVAATEFWKTIRLCESFAPVDVLSIPSNHCQWRRKKNQLGKPTDDWGIHINKILEARNEDAKLDVTFHRPDDWPRCWSSTSVTPSWAWPTATKPPTPTRSRTGGPR